MNLTCGRVNYDRVDDNGFRKEYYLGALRHRLDGPAVEWWHGGHEYWVEGQLHREDGPAVSNLSGDPCEYWLQGQRLSGRNAWLRAVVRLRIEGVGVEHERAFDALLATWDGSIDDLFETVCQLVLPLGVAN